MPEAGTARRITLFFTGGYILVTLLLGVAAYFSGSGIVEEQLDAQIRAETGDLRMIVAQTGIAGLQEALLRRDDRGVNTFGYLLVDASGRRLGGDLSPRPPAGGWANTTFSDRDGREYGARAWTSPLADGATLTVAMELSPSDRLRDRLLLVFGAGLAIMAGVGFVGGILLGKAIRARLQSINRIALAIIGGNLDERVAVSPANDEFDQLAVTVNQMLDRNADLILNLQRVSGDIAHELRTPIMRLRLRLEAALASATHGAASAADVERSIDDVDAILSLFAALLRIAEIEGGAVRSYFRPVDLSSIATTLTDSYALVALDAGRALVTEVGPGVIVNGDQDLLSQMIVNLLENAIRHTPPGSTITATLAQGSGTVTFTVADDGPGIAAHDRERAVQRFARLAQGTTGHGLGLNLVAAIVQSHSGTMILCDNHPGLLVRVSLPDEAG